MSLETLFKHPETAKVLDVLWEYRNIGLTQSEIVQEANLSNTNLIPILEELERLGILKPSEEHDIDMVYEFNTDDILVKRLVEFVNVLIYRVARLDFLQKL